AAARQVDDMMSTERPNAVKQFGIKAAELTASFIQAMQLFYERTITAVRALKQQSFLRGYTRMVFYNCLTYSVLAIIKGLFQDHRIRDLVGTLLQSQFL